MTEFTLRKGRSKPAYLQTWSLPAREQWVNEVAEHWKIRALSWSWLFQQRREPRWVEVSLLLLDSAPNSKNLSWSELSISVLPFVT